MEYVLRAQNLCKQYGKYQALHGLSMHVPRESIYGFVGRNGAGKTTLLRLITGLQEPDAGSYALFDIDHTHQEILSSRSRMGAVVETPSIYKNLTARENLEHQYQVLGIPGSDGIDELLQLVNLENTGRKKAGRFSLGMKQRLGLAIALCGSPDFLILDEPANGLDPQGMIEMRELILKLNREKGITFLISSHYLDELSRMATHFGFIDNGRMVREISAEELENSCRKNIRLSVSDPSKAAAVLTGLDLDYQIDDNSQITIYGNAEVQDLILKLSEAQIKVSSIHEQEESLESYFLNLTGGSRHE